MSEKLQYSGKVTPVGNSKGVRLDAAFFKAHPEFSGEVRVTVLSEGQALLSASGSTKARRTKSVVEKFDPVMVSFLKFLEREMIDRPDGIAAADSAQLRRIGKLVKGVDPASPRRRGSIRPAQ
jgi:hypothetical protein